MGVTGAAVGTLASRLTMLVFIIVLLLRDPRTVAIIRQMIPKRLHRKELDQLLQLGLPSSLQMFLR